MKKNFLFLLFLALVAITPAKAFLVTIPDVNFRARLQILYPTCFVGAQMETTCAGITSATTLNVSNLNIANLSGVEYFTSLQTLNCNNNQLTSLPTLPTSLQSLSCENNQLTSLPVLPSSLQILMCYGNQLVSLPTLPASLTNLGCTSNQLTSLPALPASLTYLDCGVNQLTGLPTLPASLTYLACGSNQLMSLPALPANLQSLVCQFNQLTSLPALPVSLQFLYCFNNQLTSLPALPAGFLRLEGYNNQLTSLPVLPVSLQFLACQFNLLDFADLEAINPKPSQYAANTQSYKILPATQSVATGATLTISGAIGGSLNVYQWYKNSTPISGATSATYTKTNITSADAGVYYCVVTSTYVGAGTTTGVTITSSNVTVCVDKFITTLSLPSATIGTAYSQTLAQTGLSGALTWSVSVGTLPAGLLLNASTGAITGTPTAAGTSNFTISVTDGSCSVTKIFSIVVVCPTITVTPASTLSFTVGTAISNITLGASGVSGATYTHAVTSGALPAGLTLSAGVISGTPTTVTAATFTITATASIGGCTGTVAYGYSVVCPTLVFGVTTATGATVGTAYSLNAGVTGNTQSIVYTVSSLPAGLSISNTTGTISGTPTAPATSATYTVTATQGTCSVTQGYTFAVVTPACSAVVLGVASIPNATVGTPYSQTFTATGGTTGATYAFTTAVSQLAGTGLTLSAAGVLSGTPTSSTSITFKVIATTMPNGCSGEKVYTIIINPNPATALNNDMSSLVKISPNPSSGDFVVDFGAINTAKVVMRVHNAQGKQVFILDNNSNNGNNQMAISLGNMANGIYLLQISTEKGNILKKIVKAD